MKKIIFLLFVTVFVYSQKGSPAVELANAERAFSTASEKIGVKESFLQFLSDDCVMFNPYPVNGKELYRNRPSNSAYLTWRPTFVEVSASGDFGISSGPWEYRSSKTDTQVSVGHYFSVWKKLSNGSWKVVLDNGIRYPLDVKRNEREHIVMLPLLKPKQSKGENARVELLETEYRFIKSIKEKGAIESYSKFAADNIRLYRKGNFPSQKKSEAIDVIRNQELQKDFSPMATQAALSGDIGFTYGFSVNSKKDSSSYVRVWRKEKEWMIAVEILEPITTK